MDMTVNERNYTLYQFLSDNKAWEQAEKNYKREKDPIYPYQNKYQTLPELLVRCPDPVEIGDLFSWKNSSEGQTYWYELNYAFIKQHPRNRNKAKEETFSPEASAWD